MSVPNVHGFIQREHLDPAYYKPWNVISLVTI
jgi:hypothetical protein